MLFWENSDTEA